MTEREKIKYAEDVMAAARIATMCRLLTTNTSGMICWLMERERLKNEDDPFGCVVDSIYIMEELGINQPTFCMAINTLVDKVLVVEVNKRASGRSPKDTKGRRNKFYKLSKSARLVIETIDNLKTDLWLE